MRDPLILRAWVVAVIAGAGTFLTRASLLVLARRLTDLPDMLRVVLRMIPPAVLAAIVAPAVLRPEGPLALLQPRLLAALVAIVVAWRTRSMLWTLLVGMAALLGVSAVL
jgi:branched-subunit amino acid transport protein